MVKKKAMDFEQQLECMRKIVRHEERVKQEQDDKIRMTVSNGMGDLVRALGNRVEPNSVIARHDHDVRNTSMSLRVLIRNAWSKEKHVIDVKCVAVDCDQPFPVYQVSHYTGTGASPTVYSDLANLGACLTVVARILVSIGE